MLALRILALAAAALPALAAPAQLSKRDVQYAQASFTDFNGGTTACGSQVSNSDFVLGVGDGIFAGGNNCGRQITIIQQGRPDVNRTATIVDSCGDVRTFPGFFCFRSHC